MFGAKSKWVTNTRDYSLKDHRLSLTPEDQKTVEVFNLRTGERVHGIKDFSQPLTMAFLAESNRLIVTDGGDSDGVQLVDCKEYKIISTLKLGPGSGSLMTLRLRKGPQLSGFVLKRFLSISSDLIFDSSVDRGMPNFAAAPVGPNTRPRLAFRASSIMTSALSE